jgi:hypothetical protein
MIGVNRHDIGPAGRFDLDHRHASRSKEVRSHIES